MNTLRLLSWNVNGIRAVERKGELQRLLQTTPDVLCLQEVKAAPEQLGQSLLAPPGYYAYWESPARKGYSGVSILSRSQPLEIRAGFGVDRFDNEGRTLVARYPSFLLYNVYFPNGKASQERLDYKMDFYEAFLAHISGLRDCGERLVICGDYNTAHSELDLARPKENSNQSGFLPREREWMDRLVDAGFIDTFRMFHAEGERYSWWDLKSRARERNVGWRIDYFFVSDNLRDAVIDADIHAHVQGSDHCPVSLTVRT
ncbi:MAG TPA: exodeoxyribonuclease III [Anaerolineae bacterium]|nr:exodeoxyribonuclease III [Anaerolineae bacterium]